MEEISQMLSEGSLFQSSDLIKALKASLKERSEEKTRLLLHLCREEFLVDGEEDQFFNVLSNQGQFSYKQQSQIALLLNLKQDYEHKELEYVDIRSAISCKDFRDSKDLITEHYHLDEKVDFVQLWRDLCKVKVRNLSETFNSALLEIIVEQKLATEVEPFKQLIALCPELHILPFLEYQEASFHLGGTNLYEKSELIFVSHLFDEKLFRVATELQLKVNDQNLFGLIWILDQLNPKFTQITGVCFYTGKLI
mmetsp:Transcript_25392/g.24739  ORF Transcript_25392/g.24739 Transcript_25392/m.24739 type:complete len:252 (+) Transcript_25392:1489-2244(+)